MTGIFTEDEKKELLNVIRAVRKFCDVFLKNNLKNRIPVDALEISVRSSNVLYQNKIFYIDELNNMTVNELTELYGIGKSSVTDIINALKREGITLHDE